MDRLVKFIKEESFKVEVFDFFFSEFLAGTCRWALVGIQRTARIAPTVSRLQSLEVDNCSRAF